MDRQVYFAVGGFAPVPLMEEYALVQKLKGLGPVRILPEKVATSARRYEKNGRVFNSLRNVGLVLLYYLGFSPYFLARLYR